MSEIFPIILSGGSGTRLWPASRSMYPKQLLPLTGEKTMLQQTELRLQGIELIDGFNDIRDWGVHIPVHHPSGFDEWIGNGSVAKKPRTI